MKVRYNLEGLDCPNCSAKIEKEVGKLPYVSDSLVNLFKQTIDIECEDGQEEILLADVKKIVKLHEPDVVVSKYEKHSRSKSHTEEHDHSHEHEDHEGHEHHHHHGDECCCGHDHEHEEGHDHHHDHEEHEHHHHGDECCCGHDHEHEHDHHDHEKGHEHHHHGDDCCCGHDHKHDHAEEEAASNGKKRVKYNLEGLDCPNCSAKIEAEVGKLPYVSDSLVNLFKQTIDIEIEDGKEEVIFEDVKKIVKLHEPDVVVSKYDKHSRSSSHSEEHEGHEHHHHHGEDCCCGHDHKHEHDEGHDHHHHHDEEDCCCGHDHHHEHEHHHDEEHEHSNAEKSESAANASEKEKLTSDQIMVRRLIIGGIIYAIGFAGYNFFGLDVVPALVFFIVSYIILGYDVVLTAIRNISHGKVFDEHFLMSISTIGAFIIGEYPEAVAVMLFYQIGEFCQDKAVDKSRRSISGLMEIRPDRANINQNGNIISVPAEEIEKGEEIIVRPGERVPLDGVVSKGKSSLDTMALTGESLPRDVAEGDPVFSGSINLNGVLTIKVLKSLEDSTASKIIEMVENASARKAPTEKFITRFAAVYTPIVVFLAAALAIIPPLFLGGEWADWVHRAFVFLVVSCPCAFVIAIPLTFFGGIGAAAKKGVLVKGGNYLEALNDVDTIVFDKTGTLTKGVFNVTHIAPVDGVSEDELLEKAAMAESYSNHPIAESIVKAYGKQIDENLITDVKELAGHGISALYNGKRISVGNEKLMTSENIAVVINEHVGTKIYVAEDERYIGCIVIADELKADSKKAVSELKALGINRMVMLTGDNKAIAKHVADELGMDEYYAELLPGDKVDKLEEIDKNKNPKKKLAFVGDGINDAPVLARADVGISMGTLGADAAIEAADVVLMTDEPSRITDAIKVASKTKQIVMQNIVFALVVKVVFLILGSMGIAGMWEAVFGDVGVTLIAVANSLRMMNIK